MLPNLKITFLAVSTFVTSCSATETSKRTTSADGQNTETVSEIGSVQDEGWDGPTASDKNGIGQLLVKKDDELILKLNVNAALPIKIYKDLGELKSIADSIMILRIENPTTTAMGTGAIDHKSGNMVICSCDGGDLNIGPLPPDGCSKIMFFLSSDDTFTQTVTSDLFGILEINVTGVIPKGEEIPGGTNGLNIGGSCVK
jgi:hypothetical protein